jgi:hypothetical protein
MSHVSLMDAMKSRRLHGELISVSPLQQQDRVDCNAQMGQPHPASRKLPALVSEPRLSRLQEE